MSVVGNIPNDVDGTDAFLAEVCRLEATLDEMRERVDQFEDEFQTALDELSNAGSNP